MVVVGYKVASKLIDRDIMLYNDAKQSRFCEK